MECACVKICAAESEGGAVEKIRPDEVTVGIESDPRHIAELGRLRKKTGRRRRRRRRLCHRAMGAFICDVCSWRGEGSLKSQKKMKAERLR